MRYYVPMTDCIFCKIIDGSVPAHVVYEDSDFLAFLDIRPLSPGHTLVVPKKHYRYVWDVPTDRDTSPNIAAYFELVQKIARALQRVSKTDQVRMKVIGDEVPHAHVWVFADPDTAKGSKDTFAENAELLRAALSQEP